MRKIDTKKIIALYTAGWKEEEIATEMEITPEIVKEVLYCNQKEKVSKEERKDIKTHIILTTQELKQIYEKAAVIGAQEGIKTFEQERKREYSHKADKRLRNTKLLLRNYHMLKEHTEKSIFGRVQMKESALDILESMMSLYDNEVIIESIKRSATRTAIIVSHIEAMLGLYKIYCEKSVNPKIDQRRYEVIWDMYLADQLLTAEEIADKQHISKESVYSDIKIAIERLAALIFGVDGLNVQ